MVLLAASLAACGTPGDTPPGDTPPGPPKPPADSPAVVLVHGAFADGSSWSKVIPILQAAGVPVVAAQLPLSSLSEDTAAATRLIDLQPSPVVLVGHSWGGTVITEAGNNDKVKALVYVAAFAPDTGQSVGTLLADLPDPVWFADLIADAGGNLRLSNSAISKYFAPDVPLTESALIAATQGPIAGASLEQTVTAAAWRDKPTHYIVSDNDQIIPTVLQEDMATAMSAETTTLQASHVPMLSRPDEVAEAILDVVAEVGASM